MIVLDPSHPSTAGLPPRWKVQDEIYNFVQDPRSFGAKVVLAADDSSYVGTFEVIHHLMAQPRLSYIPSLDTGDRNPAQGSPHPIGKLAKLLAPAHSVN